MSILTRRNDGTAHMYGRQIFRILEYAVEQRSDCFRATQIPCQYYLSIIAVTHSYHRIFAFFCSHLGLLRNTRLSLSPRYFSLGLGVVPG